jgi:hypothetical protein
LKCEKWVEMFGDEESLNPFNEFIAGVDAILREEISEMEI